MAARRKENSIVGRDHYYWMTLIKLIACTCQKDKKMRHEIATDYSTYYYDPFPRSIPSGDRLS